MTEIFDWLGPLLDGAWKLGLLLVFFGCEESLSKCAKELHLLRKMKQDPNAFKPKGAPDAVHK